MNQGNAPFNNTATQSEKREVLANDRGAARLHLIAKPVSSAVDPSALYPRLPPSSPWAQPGPGLEPPIPPAKPRGAR
jgi:hypothetical protein